MQHGLTVEIPLEQQNDRILKMADVYLENSSFRRAIEAKDSRYIKIFVQERDMTAPYEIPIINNMSEAKTNEYAVYIE